MDAKSNNGSAAGAAANADRPEIQFTTDGAAALGVKINPDATVHSVAQGLIRAGHFKLPEDSVPELTNPKTGEAIPPGTTFRQAGIGAGSQVHVTGPAGGAASFDQEMLTSRLGGDRLLAAKLNNSEAPVFITGHRSHDDAVAGMKAVPLDGSGIHPTFYRVEYQFETLAGPGTRRVKPAVVISLLGRGAGTYPELAPVVMALKPYPWVPRVSLHSGRFCLEDETGKVPSFWTPWVSDLATVVTWTGQLLNLDEPLGARADTGYNPAAHAHWKNHLKLQPLHPDLRWPTVSLEPGIGHQDHEIVTGSGPDDYEVVSAVPPIDSGFEYEVVGR